MKNNCFAKITRLGGLAVWTGLTLAAGTLFTNQAMAWETNTCPKLTGGGWIIATNGAKATFAVEAGIRRGQFWGGLNYIDHGTGMHVQSRDVVSVSFDPNDDACVDATYDVDIDGTPGTAYVIACDNDDTGNGESEQGPKDTFSIVLSNGYMASGPVGGDQPGGGTIQLHKCPPGWQ